MSQNRNAMLSADNGWIAEMARLVKEDQGVIRELAERISEKPQSIKEQVTDILEDAAYAKEVLGSPVEFTMTSMAKDLGMTGAPSLQRELEDIGVIYRKGVTYHLHSDFCGYGFTAYKLYKGEQLMVWTQKGRAWLHNLAKRGLLMTEPRPRKTYVRHKKSRKKTDALKTSEEVAAMFGMKHVDFEEWLHETGIVVWDEYGTQPKGIYVSEGYSERHSRIKGSHEIYYPMWTEKGVRWIKELMKMPDPHGYLRNRERYEGSHMVPSRIQEDAPKSTVMPKSVRNTDMLMNLIEQMQGYFECIVSLAKDCIRENDETDKRLLKGDIRSINDSTTLMMRKLEDECYKALA